MGIESFFDCHRTKSSNTAKNTERHSWDYGKSGRCVGYTVEVNKIIRNVNRTVTDTFFIDNEPVTIPGFSSYKDGDNEAIGTKCTSSTSSFVEPYEATFKRGRENFETAHDNDVDDPRLPQEQKNGIDSWLDSSDPARPDHELCVEDKPNAKWFVTTRDVGVDTSDLIHTPSVKWFETSRDEGLDTSDLTHSPSKKWFVTTRDVGVDTSDLLPAETRTDITKKEEQLRCIRFFMDKLEQAHQKLSEKSSDSIENSPCHEIVRSKFRRYNPPAPSYDQEGDVEVLECDSVSSVTVGVSEPTTNDFLSISEKSSSPITKSYHDSLEDFFKSFSATNNRNYNLRAESVSSRTGASSPSHSMICHASSSADFCSDSTLSSMNLDLIFGKPVETATIPDTATASNPTDDNHHRSSSFIDAQLLFGDSSTRRGTGHSNSDTTETDVTKNQTRGHSSSPHVYLGPLSSDKSISITILQGSSSGEIGCPVDSDELSTLGLYSLFKDSSSEPSRCQVKTESEENGPCSHQVATESFQNGKTDGTVPVIRDIMMNNVTAADTWRVSCNGEANESMIRSSKENNYNNSDPSAGIIEIWSTLGKEKASKVLQDKRIKAQCKRRRRKRNRNVKKFWESYDQ